MTDITIKIVLAAIVVMLAIGAKAAWDTRMARERLHRYLLRTWGKPAERDYPEEQWQAIREYYEAQPERFDIDDITWNDLNLDAIYQKLNHTRTSMGEEYLYRMLRKPSTDSGEMAERERVISYLQEEEDGRMRLQQALAEIGKLERMSVYQHLQQVKKLPPDQKRKHIGACLLMLFCLVLCFVKPDVMVLVSIIVMGGNIISYYVEKSNMDSFLRFFTFVLRMVEQCENVASLNIPELADYQAALSKATACFGKYKRFSFLVEGGKRMNGDILDSLMDYVRMIFHVDLIKMATMTRAAKQYQGEMLVMYETIGFLDSMLSVASCRAMYEVSCVPELVQDETVALTAENLYHPLLPDGVANSIDTGTSVLLTGSNASGKSTYIKAVAVNALLAQTIHTVIAGSYRASWFRIASSMALRDDILNQESYFIVEIKSLKRIIDLAEESDLPVLCFIDEVLRGTNTVERIAASSRILEEIAVRGNLCFAATHDIELSYLLEKHFANYHFEEQVTEDDVQFDYRLREGRACTRNAIRLLQMMGYDKAIVQDATDRVSRFLDTGAWKA